MRLLKAIERYTDEALLAIMGLFFYIAASATQTGWLYFIVALIITLLAVSFIIPRLNIRDLEVWREVPPYVFEGDTAVVLYCIKNRSPKHKYVLYLEIVQKDGYFEARETQLFQIHSLAPGEVRKVYVEYNCLRRGKALMSPYSVGSSFPFSYFTARRKIIDSLVLYIYPQAPRPAALLSGRGAEWHYGHHRNPFLAGKSYDFLGIRDYRPSDELRFIHWPSTARLNRIMVKEFSEPAQQNVVIVIDTLRSASWGEGLHNTLEYEVKLAAGIVHFCSRNSISLTLISSGPSSDREIYNPSRLQALEYLSALTGDGSFSTTEILNMRSNDISSRAHIIILQGSYACNVDILAKEQFRDNDITLFLLQPSTFVDGEDGLEERYSALGEALRQTTVDVIPVKKGDDLKALLEGGAYHETGR